jgi:predicted pyridoxine 5'-phosphate oxidase superfamily flavin-nucleotide-binding protein
VVVVSDKIKEMIRTQRILIVGSANKDGICNVSPRTSFHLGKDGSVYWLEFFRHKTFRNFKANPWCSIAVFDKNKLTGFQLKGKISIVKDKKTRKEISVLIIDKLTRLHKQKILKLTNKKPQVIRFVPQIIYTLNPNELADSPLTIHANDESLAAADMQW